MAVIKAFSPEELAYFQTWTGRDLSCALCQETSEIVGSQCFVVLCQTGHSICETCLEDFSGQHAVLVKRYTRQPMSHAKRMRVFEKNDFQCVSCSARKDLSVDHIFALANGGTNDDDNLQTLCRTCNTKKGTKTDWSHFTTGSVQ